MKKTILLGVVIILTILTTQAQSNESLMNINAGIGGISGTNSIATPSFNVSYEYFLSDTFSIGVLGGYSTIIEPEEFGQEEEKTGGINIGGIANYYISNSDNFDLYIGTILGYDGHKYEYSDGGLLYEFHVGARYTISKNMSLNSELGWGLALLKVGISFKL